MSGRFEDHCSETLKFNIDPSNLITSIKYGPHTFLMPSADSSPHPPGCRYDRLGTAFRDPIPAFVSYFWVAPAWSSRRNWCPGVVHFACSSSSTWPSYFPNAYSPFDVGGEPVFIYSPRGTGVKNATRESPLRRSGTHHFETTTSRFDFSSTYRFVTFTVLSLRPRCDLWPNNHASPRTLGRRSTSCILSQIDTFYDVLEGESVAIMALVNLFACP